MTPFFDDVADRPEPTPAAPLCRVFQQLTAGELATVGRIARAVVARRGVAGDVDILAVAEARELVDFCADAVRALARGRA